MQVTGKRNRPPLAISHHRWLTLALGREAKDGFSERSLAATASRHAAHADIRPKVEAPRSLARTLNSAPRGEHCRRSTLRVPTQQSARLNAHGCIEAGRTRGGRADADHIVFGFS